MSDQKNQRLQKLPEALGSSSLQNISPQYTHSVPKSENATEAWRKKQVAAKSLAAREEIGAGLAHPSSTRDSSHPPSSTLIAPPKLHTLTPGPQERNPRPHAPHALAPYPHDLPWSTYKISHHHHNTHPPTRLASPWADDSTLERHYMCTLE